MQKRVENGLVRQWSNQRQHEHWRFRLFLWRWRVRRVGWLQAMLRDETNHAQPVASIFGRFLEKEVLEEKGGLCEEQTHSRWPSIEKCACLKGSRAQKSFTRLFGRMGSIRSSWHSLRRGRFFFFFLRIDTSLLRAACWTLASGMRLASQVKFQCGEIRKFDWCCEIQSEAGALSGSRFQSKRGVISCGAIYTVMDVRHRSSQVSSPTAVHGAFLHSQQH